jgi:hypothetical protein
VRVESAVLRKIAVTMMLLFRGCLPDEYAKGD